MTQQKITFTVKSIKTEDINTNIRIIDLDFPVDGGKISIVRIYFIMHDASQKSKLDILEEQGTYELNFDDGEMRVNKSEGGPTLNMAGSCSSAESSSSARKEGGEPKKGPFVMVNEENKEIRVIVYPEFQLNIKEVKESENDNSDQNQNDNNDNQDNKSVIEKNIQEIKNKLKAKGINKEQEIEILGNSWETDYKMSHHTSKEEIEGFKNERIAAIEKWKKPSDNKGPSKKDGEDEQPTTPPPAPQPTQKEVDEATDKIKQAQTEQDILDALKNTQQTARNSSDENLKKAREEKERKLSKDKLREVIREEIQKELELNGLKPEELPSPIKQKFDEINNNNNNNNNDQITRTEILQAVGQQSLTKLITDLQKALEEKKEKEITAKVKVLEEFIASSVDYKKAAYQLQKETADNLLKKAKKQSNPHQSSNSPNQDKDKFFRLSNPFLWISGVAIIAIIGGAIVVVRRRKLGKVSGK
ncbi:MAG: hypothetical protein I3273_07205 [Candidatus Moeniiplasma glomeromycotorum]|nr:hypothetical protein [Candidatus Moeniiplasma glomeromycotorum]MCE8169873.1 hypothetical protein [Candidatus Moeniiplasma glomeromycotorum]